MDRMSDRVVMRRWAVVFAALCSVLCVASALAQGDGGEVMYRARTDVDGRRIGVDVRMIDPAGVARWAAYTTTVTPSLGNQIAWDTRDCSETQVDGYLGGSEHTEQSDLVVGFVPCGDGAAARYWSLTLVDGSMPTSWRSARPFRPTLATGDGGSRNVDDGGKIQRLEGGMAVWVRSAAVLAGFATVAVIVVGAVLYRRLKNLEGGAGDENGG